MIQRQGEIPLASQWGRGRTSSSDGQAFPIAFRKPVLAQTNAKVRSQEAQGRASWWQLKSAQEAVRAQLANLRANVASLQVAEANLTYARGELNRVGRLAATGAAPAEELEQRRNAVRVADSQLTSAGLPIVMSSGVPTPEVSAIVPPLPSLKSYRAWIPAATRCGVVRLTVTVAVEEPPAPSDTV